VARQSALDRLSRRTSVLRPARVLGVGYRVVRRVLARLGLQVVYATYDSPIPRVEDFDDAFFERPSAMLGMSLDEERCMRFVEQELAPYLAEFRPRTDAEVSRGTFTLRNGTYESVDAESLYAIVRYANPRRIVELGSGWSTLVVREALALNEAEGHPVSHLCFDPYPSDRLPDTVSVERRLVQELGPADLAELGDGDILFVDTSHSVKVGGDVNHIVLELLPTLAPGVLVHFHDIFLPFHYSRGHIDDAHYWAEQYLLQAYLAENPRWETMLPAQALARAFPERLAVVIPSFGSAVSPGAFWVRRLA
jgi:hypothetical protein